SVVAATSTPIRTTQASPDPTPLGRRREWPCLVKVWSPAWQLDFGSCLPILDCWPCSPGEVTSIASGSGIFRAALRNGPSLSHGPHVGRGGAPSGQVPGRPQRRATGARRVQPWHVGGDQA